MELPIRTSEELGLLIRATRKQQRVRMDDVAGSAGVGHVFVREVERGKPTVQIGRVMRVLAELGIELRADVPDDIVPAFEQLKATGLRPVVPRRGVAGRPVDTGATASVPETPQRRPTDFARSGRT